MISQRDIVLVPWPFRDNKGTKVRPVVVLSNEKYNKSFADFIGVAVTSNLDIRDHTVLLTEKELEKGSLKVASVVKVDYVSSMEQSLVRKKIGRITKRTFESIINQLVQILSE